MTDELENLHARNFHLERAVKELAAALSDESGRRKTAEGRIGAVRSLHAPREALLNVLTDEFGTVCEYCDAAEWPCPTITALEGGLK